MIFQPKIFYDKKNPVYLCGNKSEIGFTIDSFCNIMAEGFHFIYLAFGFS